MPSSQKRLDAVMGRIDSSSRHVRFRDIVSVLETIQERCSGNDLILSSLSAPELLRHEDLLLRAVWEMIRRRRFWGLLDRHYVTSKLRASSYGFTSETRKRIFVEKRLVLSGEVDINDRYGCAECRFFTLNGHPILFLSHKHGYASITNFAEQVVSTVQEEYLNDVGFNVWDDRIKVYYRDLSGTHCQVRLDRDLSNPRWIDLRESASAWFDRVWEWMEQPRPKADLPEKPVFIEGGQPYAAYDMVRRIVTATLTDLFIIDPWVDGDLVQLVTNTRPSVRIRMLTMKPQGDSRVLARKFREERKRLEMRKTHDFHDRYIFSDRRCYMLGSSVNSLGRTSTSLIPIQDELFIDSLRQSAESSWNRGAPIE